MIAETLDANIVQRADSVVLSSPRQAREWRTHRRCEIHQPRTINVALLGCGVVGSEVARFLLGQRHFLATRAGVDVQLKTIFVRDRTRDRGLNHQPLTDQFEDVLRSKPDVVIEALGGLTPAYDYVRTLLACGIDVVSANKTLLAHRVADLQQIAANHGSRIAFEAAVCSAIPVLTAIERLRCDRVRSVTGIVNGTCNYILTRMTEDGLELEQALQEAQSLGFAETDPSADLSGRDSAEKLAILVSASGIAHLQPHDICTFGIQHVTQRDIHAAKRRGCVIKLIASATKGEDGVRVCVCPTLLPRQHPLASVRLQNNAVTINCENSGPLFLQGLGAGPRPTAAAIVADLIELRYSTSAAHVPGFMTPNHRIARDIKARCIVRVTPDPERRQPDKILAVLNDRGIAVREIECCHNEVQFATGVNAISSVTAAIRDLCGTEGESVFLAIDGRSHSTCATLDGSSDADRGRSDA